MAALGVNAPALYYVTMPAGHMSAVVGHVSAACADRGMPGDAPDRILGVADAGAFGALAAPPTLVIDVGRFAARKLAAIRCHRTQLEGDALSMIAESDAGRLLGREQLHRGGVGSQSGVFLEQFASPARL